MDADGNFTPAGVERRRIAFQRRGREAQHLADIVDQETIGFAVLVDS